MYKEKEIFYKNTKIHKIEDLKTTLPTNKSKNSKDSQIFRIAAENPTANQSLENILRTEIITRQYNRFPKNYTLEDMLLVQEHLDALDCVETIKYAPFNVYAKQVLYEYLYSRYDISACNYNLLSQTQNVTHKNKFLSKDKISSPTELLNFTAKQKDNTPSKTIRNYVSDYLLKQSNYDKHPNTQCGLYLNKASQSINGISKQRFYLPLYEVPIFLLLFTFFDRRAFGHTESQIDPNRLPRLKLNTDEAVYKVVFSKAQDIFKSYKNNPLSISYIWRCDNIFLFHKFNMLLKYYDLYSSPETLSAIVRRYNFEYNQTAKIKNTINKIIFEDKDFIKLGLKSRYLDFMLPFNIPFQSDISAPNLGNTPEDFEIKLRQLKDITKQVVDTKLSLKCNNPIFSFSKDDYFSIPDNEKKICDFLENNNFYRSFYHQTEFLDKFLRDNKNNNDFYSYSTIETIIKENTES